MGVMVNSSHVVFAAPSSSHSSPPPLWGPSCGRQSSMNGSNVSPFHALQFLMSCSSVGPFPRGVVLWDQTAPVWVPPWVTSPASKPAPVWAPLSLGPQVLPGACSSTGLPRGHGLLRASTYSGMGSLPQATGGYLLCYGSPWTARGQSVSPWFSPWAAGKKSLLRCLVPAPPSSLNLVLTELYLPIFLLLSPVAIFFSPA